MAHSPQVPFPSTSTASAPNPLFNAHHQLMHTSPPAGAIQAMMANSFLFPNSFLNPLAAFGSTNNLNSRFQQCFQQNSPYTSPLHSNTPSLLGSISGLSLFTNNSSTTSTLTQNNSQFGSKSVKNGEKEHAEHHDFIKLLLDIFGNDPNDAVVMELLKSLRTVIELINSDKTLLKYAKDLHNLIRFIINRLYSSKDQNLKNGLAKILASLSASIHFQTVVREEPMQILQKFTDLTLRASSLAGTSGWNSEYAVSVLRIFYNSLSEIKDKRAAKTEAHFSALINFLALSGPVPHTTIKFLVLGILRVLLHAEDGWKKFFIDQQGMVLILRLISQNHNKKFIRQAIRTLNTLVDSNNTEFATSFVQQGGIEKIVSKVDISPDVSHDDLFPPLLCLKLISDIPALAHLEREINLALHLSIRGILPLKEASGTNKSEGEMFGRNIANALGFIRNALARNENGRNYLAALDQGRLIPHLISLADQSFSILPEFSQNQTGNKCKIEIDVRKKHLLDTILENSLAILALINKESAKGNVSHEQKMASRKLAESETKQSLYQVVLRFDNAELQKHVLTSLRRILNAGVSLPIESHRLQIAETLLNFLFAPNPSPNRMLLMKMSAEVLSRLVADPGRLHLSVVTPLLNNEMYQPFKLLNTIQGNSDLYMAVLKLIKELCQREPSLKTIWSDNGIIGFLKFSKTTSSNPGIVDLCSNIFDMLQMQMGEDEPPFYSFFAFSQELDQSELS